jgi:hypothetical protein
MINKILMLLVLLIVSCTTYRIKGPNYNQGRTHNADNANRSRIVNSEDLRMKQAMQRERDRASKNKIKRKRVKKHNKYI